MRRTPPLGLTMAEPALLEAAGLRLSLPDYNRKPPFGAAPTVDILHGIDLTLAPGDTLGIVGESGSGKTSLGRTLIRLYAPTGGRLLFDGQDITNLPEARLRPLRARFQMIFQDPQSSLNPRRRVADIVAQPLHLHGRAATNADASRCGRLQRQSCGCAAGTRRAAAGPRCALSPRAVGRRAPACRHRPGHRLAAAPRRRRRRSTPPPATPTAPASMSRARRMRRSSPCCANWRNRTPARRCGAIWAWPCSSSATTFPSCAPCATGLW